MSVTMSDPRIGMRSEGGFTLLETLIGMGLISVLMLGAAGFLGRSVESLKAQRLVANRQRIVNSLVKQLGMPSALRNSAPMDPVTRQLALTGVPQGNQYLFDCLYGGPCPFAEFHPFQLYGPSLSKTANSTQITSGPVTGTPNDPTYYDIQGLPCSDASCPADQYPFGVFTEITAICPPDPSPGDILTTGLYPRAECSGSSVGGGMQIVVKLSVLSRTSANPVYEATIPTWGYAIVTGTWR